MNINPISFGRGIKMYGPKRVAEQIQSAVNQKQYSQNMKAMKEFAMPIFYDAQGVGNGVEIFSISDDKHYLFSGEEAKKAREIIENTRYNCQKNMNDARRSANNEEQRIEYEKIAHNENSKLVKVRNNKLKELSDGSPKSNKSSFIEVKSYNEIEDNGVVKQTGVINYASFSNQVTQESTFKYEA